jgi:pyruvate kinase
MTESGSTPLWMTRYNTSVPIYAFSKNIRTLRRLSLYREVTVMQQLETDMPPYEVAEKVASILTAKGIVSKGDTIVITRGSTMGKSGTSDTMQIRKIP